MKLQIFSLWSFYILFIFATLQDFHGPIQTIEVVVMVWILSLALQEVQQAQLLGLRRYLDSNYNVSDIFLILLYHVCAFLRVYYLRGDTAGWLAGGVDREGFGADDLLRTFYAVLLVATPFRPLFELAFASTSDRTTGLYLMALRKMFANVLNLFPPLAVILVGFGFAFLVLLPNYELSEYHLNLVEPSSFVPNLNLAPTGPFFIPVWGLFGYFEPGLTADSRDAVELFPQLLLIVFLLLALLIFLNLLIALFNETFATLRVSWEQEAIMTQQASVLGYLQMQDAPPPVNLFFFLTSQVRRVARASASLLQRCLCSPLRACGALRAASCCWPVSGLGRVAPFDASEESYGGPGSEASEGRRPGAGGRAEARAVAKAEAKAEAQAARAAVARAAVAREEEALEAYLATLQTRDGGETGAAHVEGLQEKLDELQERVQQAGGFGQRAVAEQRAQHFLGSSTGGEQHGAGYSGLTWTVQRVIEQMMVQQQPAAASSCTLYPASSSAGGPMRVPPPPPSESDRLSPPPLVTSSSSVPGYRVQGASSSSVPGYRVQGTSSSSDPELYGVQQAGVQQAGVQQVGMQQAASQLDELTTRQQELSAAMERQHEVLTSSVAEMRSQVKLMMKALKQPPVRAAPVYVDSGGTAARPASSVP